MVVMSGSVPTRGRTLDHAAACYDILSPLMTLGAEERLIKKSLDMFCLSGRERVLDLGCGTGLMTFEIGRRLTTGEVVGIDAAAAMIARARVKNRAGAKVRFEAAAAERLPYGDGSFDAVCSAMFFHHVDQTLKRDVLREVRRVLRPSGRALLIDVDVPQTVWGMMCAWAGFILFRQDEIRDNIKGGFREAIGAAGFSSVRRVASSQGYMSAYILEV